MADIACIFHWAPATMDGLTPEELGAWHERAIVRLKALKGVKD